MLNHATNDRINNAGIDGNRSKTTKMALIHGDQTNQNQITKFFSRASNEKHGKKGGGKVKPVASGEGEGADGKPICSRGNSRAA